MVIGRIVQQGSPSYAEHGSISKKNIKQQVIKIKIETCLLKRRNVGLN